MDRFSAETPLIEHPARQVETIDPANGDATLTQMSRFLIVKGNGELYVDLAGYDGSVQANVELPPLPGQVLPVRITKVYGASSVTKVYCFS